MILGIVGSRHFGADGPRRNSDLRKCIALVVRIIGEMDVSDRIVSGGQVGVDTLAEEYAAALHIPFNGYPYTAESGTLTERYHKRDRKIATVASVLLAVPCQHSKGTWVTVRYFEQIHPGQRARVQHVDCVTGEVIVRS